MASPATARAAAKKIRAQIAALRKDRAAELRAIGEACKSASKGTSAALKRLRDAAAALVKARRAELVAQKKAACGPGPAARKAKASAEAAAATALAEAEAAAAVITAAVTSAEDRGPAVEAALVEAGVPALIPVWRELAPHVEAPSVEGAVAVLVEYAKAAPEDVVAAIERSGESVAAELEDLSPEELAALPPGLPLEALASDEEYEAARRQPAPPAPPPAPAASPLDDLTDGQILLIFNILPGYSSIAPFHRDPLTEKYDADRDFGVTPWQLRPILVLFEKIGALEPFGSGAFETTTNYGNAVKKGHKYKIAFAHYQELLAAADLEAAGWPERLARLARKHFKVQLVAARKKRAEKRAEERPSVVEGARQKGRELAQRDPDLVHWRVLDEAKKLGYKDESPEEDAFEAGFFEARDAAREAAPPAPPPPPPPPVTPEKRSTIEGPKWESPPAAPVSGGVPTPTLDRLGIVVAPLPRDALISAYRNSSWDPERRAEEDQRSYLARIETMAAMAAGRHDEARARELVLAFEQGYRARVLALKAARSRVASSAVVGPANFPTARNEKALLTERKRAEELAEYDRKFTASVAHEARTISADSGDAIGQLQAKLQELDERDRNLEAVKAVANDKSLSYESKKRRLMELGLSSVAADWGAQGGWARIQFSRQNLRQERKRIEERIEALQKEGARGEVEAETELPDGIHLRILDSPEKNRIQLFFSDRIGSELAARLKSRGWRWAPSEKAWQRQRTDNARFSVRELFGVDLGSAWQGTPPRAPAPPVELPPSLPPPPPPAPPPPPVQIENRAWGAGGELVSSDLPPGLLDRVSEILPGWTFQLAKRDIKGETFWQWKATGPNFPAKGVTGTMVGDGALSALIQVLFSMRRDPFFRAYPEDKETLTKIDEAWRLAGKARADADEAHTEAIKAREAAPPPPPPPPPPPVFRPAEGFRPASEAGQVGALFQDIEPAPLVPEIEALGVPVRWQGDVLRGWSIAPDLFSAIKGWAVVPLGSEAASHFPEIEASNVDDQTEIAQAQAAARRAGGVVVQIGEGIWIAAEDSEVESIADDVIAYLDDPVEGMGGDHVDLVDLLWPVLYSVRSSATAEGMKYRQVKETMSGFVRGTLRAIGVLGKDRVFRIAGHPLQASWKDRPGAGALDYINFQATAFYLHEADGARINTPGILSPEEVRKSRPFGIGLMTVPVGQALNISAPALFQREQAAGGRQDEDEDQPTPPRASPPPPSAAQVVREVEESRARAVQQVRSRAFVSADDPNAIEEIRNKADYFTRMRFSLDQLRAIANDKARTFQEKKARLEGVGMTPEDAAVAAQSWRFLGWNSQKLAEKARRLSDRLERLSKEKEIPSREVRFTRNGQAVRVLDNARDNRIQIFYEGRPSEEEIAMLRRSGWRWAPSVGAWQRQRTANARSRLITMFGAESSLRNAPEVSPDRLPVRPSAAELEEDEAQEAREAPQDEAPPPAPPPPPTPPAPSPWKIGLTEEEYVRLAYEAGKEVRLTNRAPPSWDRIRTEQGIPTGPHYRAAEAAYERGLSEGRLAAREAPPPPVVVKPDATFTSQDWYRPAAVVVWRELRRAASRGGDYFPGPELQDRVLEASVTGESGTRSVDGYLRDLLALGWIRKIRHDPSKTQRFMDQTVRRAPGGGGVAGVTYPLAEYVYELVSEPGEPRARLIQFLRDSFFFRNPDKALRHALSADEERRGREPFPMFPPDVDSSVKYAMELAYNHEKGASLIPSVIDHLSMNTMINPGGVAAKGSSVIAKEVFLAQTRKAGGEIDVQYMSPSSSEGRAELEAVKSGRYGIAAAELPWFSNGGSVAYWATLASIVKPSVAFDRSVLVVERFTEHERKDGYGSVAVFFRQVPSGKDGIGDNTEQDFVIQLGSPKVGQIKIATLLAAIAEIPKARQREISETRTLEKSAILAMAIASAFDSKLLTFSRAPILDARLGNSLFFSEEVEKIGDRFGSFVAFYEKDRRSLGVLCVANGHVVQTVYPEKLEVSDPFKLASEAVVSFAKFYDEMIQVSSRDPIHRVNSLIAAVPIMAGQIRGSTGIMEIFLADPRSTPPVSSRMKGFLLNGARGASSWNQGSISLEASAIPTQGSDKDRQTLFLVTVEVSMVSEGEKLPKQTIQVSTAYPGEVLSAVERLGSDFHRKVEGKSITLLREGWRKKYTDDNLISLIVAELNSQESAKDTAWILGGFGSETRQIRKEEVTSKGSKFFINDKNVSSLDFGGSVWTITEQNTLPGMRTDVARRLLVRSADQLFSPDQLYTQARIVEIFKGEIMRDRPDMSPKNALAWAQEYEKKYGKPRAKRTSNPSAGSLEDKCKAAREEIRALELDQRALLDRLVQIKRHELTDAKIGACEAPRAAVRAKYDAEIERLTRQAAQLDAQAREWEAKGKAQDRAKLPPLAKGTSDQLIEATLGSVEPRLLPLWRELAPSIEGSASVRLEVFLDYVREHPEDATRAQKADPVLASLPPVHLPPSAAAPGGPAKPRRKPRTPPGPREASPARPALTPERVVEVARSVPQIGQGLVAVANVMRPLLAEGYPLAEVRAAVLAADRERLWELTADTGVGRFSREDLEILPPGPRGMHLAHAHILAPAAAVPPPPAPEEPAGKSVPGLDPAVFFVEGRSKIAVWSPYEPGWIAAAKRLGGRFGLVEVDTSEGRRGIKAWTFDARDEARIREALVEEYGTDGTPTPRVDLEVRPAAFNGNQQKDLFLWGRQVLSRVSRDTSVKLGEGVSILRGKFPYRGGSTKYPKIDAPSDLWILVRDVPRAIVKEEYLSGSDPDAYPHRTSNPAPEGPVVRAEDFEVRDVRPDDEIKAFVRDHHYSRSHSNAYTKVHAMYDRASGQVVGVAWWMPSMPEAHKSAVRWVDEKTGLQGDRNMVLHLSRLVVAPWLGKNAAGLLLGRSMRLIDRRKYPILLTYADSGTVDPRTGEAHKGTIYRATNWTDTGDAPGGRVWVHSVTGEQRGQKRGGVNIPSAEMRAMGFVQKASLPKRRFIQVDERALRWATQNATRTPNPQEDPDVDGEWDEDLTSNPQKNEETMEARMWIEDNKVKVEGPFNLDFQGKALELGGRWNASARHWFFPVSEEARVRAAFASAYRNGRTSNPCGCPGEG